MCIHVYVCVCVYMHMYTSGPVLPQAASPPHVECVLL